MKRQCVQTNTCCFLVSHRCHCTVLGGGFGPISWGKTPPHRRTTHILIYPSRSCQNLIRFLPWLCHLQPPRLCRVQTYSTEEHRSSFQRSSSSHPQCSPRAFHAKDADVSSQTLRSRQPLWVTPGQKGCRDKTEELKRRSKSHLSNWNSSSISSQRQPTPPATTNKNCPLSCWGPNERDLLVFTSLSLLFTSFPQCRLSL